ncbi:MAG: DUF6935 domain-containing protein, partial [Candidatus Sericytochromatia bacterium]
GSAQGGDERPGAQPTEQQKPAAEQAQPAGETSSAFAAFEARVEAAARDPRLTAKLFVEAMIRHPKDAAMSRAMATLLVVDDDLVDDPQSPSGRDFSPGRRYIYDQLEPRAYLLSEYLDQPEVIDQADLTAHIVIDDDYKAIGKGVDEAAGTAKFYIKVFNDKGTRPRPIALERRDGAWKVVEYSSLFVGT